MKKVWIIIILPFLTLNLLALNNEEVEEKGKYTYIIEKNFYTNYKIKDYNLNILEDETKFNYDHDLFLKFQGEKDELEYNFEYSDKEELEDENIYMVKYKNIEIGDIENKYNTKLKYFKNTKNIFGFKYQDNENYIYGDYSTGKYKTLKFNGGLNRENLELNQSNYIKEKFYDASNYNIQKVYFDDLDKTNNQGGIQIEGGYYKELEENVDYIFYKGFLEILKEEKGKILLETSDNSFIKPEEITQIYNLPIENWDNLDITFYNSKEEKVNFNYDIDESKKLLILEKNLEEDYKIEVSYFFKKEIINLGDVEEDSIVVFLEDTKLGRGSDYFFAEGVISFSDKLSLDGKEVTVNYKEKNDEVQSNNYVLNLNYKFFNFRYDLFFEEKRKEEVVGIYGENDNFHMEIGKEIINPNTDGDEDFLNFENRVRTEIISNNYKDFLYKKYPDTQVKEDDLRDNENVENSIEISYKSKFKIRKPVNIDMEDSNIVSFYIFNDKNLNTFRIKLGKINEDYDEDENLDTEDKNNDNLLSTSEDKGIQIFDNKYGADNGHLDTEDFNNNGVLNKVDGYIYYDIDISKYDFGWQEIRLNIDDFLEYGNYNSDEVEVFELEGISDNNLESRIYLSDITIEKSDFKKEGVIYEYTEDKLDVSVKEGVESGSLEINFDSRINNYKTLRLEVRTLESTDFKIEINDDIYYRENIIGRDEIDLDISKLEKIHSIKFTTDNYISIINLKLCNPIIQNNNFYYLKYSYKNNNIWLDKYRNYFGFGLKNLEKESIINYRIKLEKDSNYKKEYYISTNLKKKLNAKYLYDFDGTLNREYSLFYFDDNKLLELKRKEEKTELIWEMDKKKHSLEGIIKKEDNSKKASYQNEYRYSSRETKVTYKFNYDKSEYYQNNISFYKKKGIHEVNIKYNNKENYVYDNVRYDVNIFENLKIGGEVDYKKEYQKRDVNKYFPVINYSSYSKKGDVVLNIKNKLEEKEFDGKFNYTNDLYKIKLDYMQEEEEQELEFNAFFFGKNGTYKMEYKTDYIYRLINFEIESKIPYKTNIEFKPHMGYENYKNSIENFRSYYQYNLGLDLKISL